MKQDTQRGVAPSVLFHNWVVIVSFVLHEYNQRGVILQYKPASSVTTEQQIKEFVIDIHLLWTLAYLSVTVKCVIVGGGGISLQSGIKNITELENLVYKFLSVIETHFILICVLCVAFCYVGF